MSIIKAAATEDLDTAAAELAPLVKAADKLFHRGIKISLMMSGLLAEPEKDFAHNPDFLPEVEDFLRARRALLAKQADAKEALRAKVKAAEWDLLKTVDPAATPSKRISGIRCTFQTPGGYETTVTVVGITRIHIKDGQFQSAIVYYSKDDDGSSTSASLYRDEYDRIRLHDAEDF